MGAALPGCRMDTGMPPGSRNRSPTASQSRHSSLLGARSLRSSGKTAGFGSEAEQFDAAQLQIFEMAFHD